MTAGAERAGGEGVRWVLFDGRCGLCDRSVRWLLARDRRGTLRFAPLEGRVAEAVRLRHPDLPPADQTMVLVERPGTPAERVRVRSRAAVEILVTLGGAWRLLALLRAVPPFLLDPAYRFVALRRTRWFGRLPACRVPSARERERFLEVVEAAEPVASGGSGSAGGGAPSATMPEV